MPSARRTVNPIGPQFAVFYWLLDLLREHAPRKSELLAGIERMALLQVQTSAKTAAPAGLLKNLSAELARALGKPESYMMVSFQHFFLVPLRALPLGLATPATETQRALGLAELLQTTIFS